MLFRQARRRRILARHSIPDVLWNETFAQLTSLARLDADERQRLRELAVIFLHEKAIEPALGFQLEDTMRVRIAALACRPILALGLDCYDDVRSVIVHPDEFVVRGREEVDAAGVVHVSDDVLSGEAWEQGPVILAWQEVLASGRGDGFDVVAHEFAHKLDLLDGDANGTTPLHRGMSREAWAQAFQWAYDDLCARVERGEDTWLDPYAADDPSEFFAVCTELYFDVPERLKIEYPAVFSQLTAFYHPGR